MSDNKGLIATGGRLVFRHQRILWWILLVSLVLSYFGAMAPSAAFGGVLNHSLLARRGLVSTNHVFVLVDLFSRPDITLGAYAAGSFGFEIVFFLFMLFISGGVLTVYREDRRHTTPEFFEACGLYFWRFFRLMLLSLIPLAIVLALHRSIVGLTGKYYDYTPRQDYYVYLRVAGLCFIVLLFLIVRLWFDVAQVRAVAQNEHSMIRNAWRARKICFSALGTLLWMYFRISLVAWTVLGLGLWIWTYMPSPAYMASWLLLEVILIVQISVRLWLRASAITWYQHYAEEHPVFSADYTTPKPLELVESDTAQGPEPA